MKRKRCSVAQIVATVRQHELGTSVADICRKLGIAEETFWRWKQEYGELEPNGAWELKHLREESAKLKKLVADLNLGNACIESFDGSLRDECMNVQWFSNFTDARS